MYVFCFFFFRDSYSNQTSGEFIEIFPAFFFQIQIEIIHTHNILSVFGQDLIMCESDVYFETYRHVYSVLKSFTDETFPMKNYIIDVDVSCKFGDTKQTK